MADVVVSRADREAAVSALGMTMPDAWLDTGEIHRGPWLDADTRTQEECVADDVAHAIAAARAAERERCAGMVREMAVKLDDACDEARRQQKERGDSYFEGSADAMDIAGQWTCDLAERIGKGE